MFPSVFRPRTGGSHLDFVDSIRALAAVYVVIHHALPYFGEPVSTVGAAVAHFFRYGHYAVDVFITVSGFCLALPVVRAGGVLNGGVFDFFKRRARRILPPYYASMIMSLIVVALLSAQQTTTHWDTSRHVTKTGVVAHALLLQDFLGTRVGGQINYVFWSIAVEWHIYFLFPLLVFGWRRWGFVLPTLALSAAGIGTAFAVRSYPYAWWYLQYIGLFCLGTAAAKICFSPGLRSRWLRDKLPWGIISLVLAAASVACCVLLPWGRWVRLWALVDPVCGAAAAAFLVYLTRGPQSLARKILEIRPLVWIGACSYSLYLIHAHTLHLGWLVLTKWLNLGYAETVYFLTVVPATILLARLFYTAFERPFMKKRPAPSRPSTGALEAASSPEISPPAPAAAPQA